MVMKGNCDDDCGSGGDNRHSGYSMHLASASAGARPAERDEGPDERFCAAWTGVGVDAGAGVGGSLGMGVGEGLGVGVGTSVGVRVVLGVGVAVGLSVGTNVHNGGGAEPRGGVRTMNKSSSVSDVMASEVKPFISKS
ncbi:glycine-rich cell wall structural protein 1-like [Penaeus monodon]|uniref:glycine-rich cell wall structural protein 1-like n=1 Tax=Penaeus monodon TaxID=6687 RepID=UPI0018A7ABE0|nr:glycine-rich cell wall structural protein 1-like [Penaeus monodon]